MRAKFLAIGVLLGVCSIGLNGCRQQTAGSVEGGPSYPHTHTHDEPGPHDGSIVEIGAKDHHVEVVHDEGAHKIGVYILEGDAKTTVPIDAKAVTIHVTNDGESTEYELPATPQSGDGEGKSSYYEIVDEELSDTIAGHTDAKSVVARLIVTIGERPFEGFLGVEESHDHEEGEAHDDADAHEDDAAKEGEATEAPADEPKQEGAAPGEGDPVTEDADTATEGESAAPEGEAGAADDEATTTESVEASEDAAKPAQ